jgi:Zn-dependent protease with chaperone function
MYSLNKHWPYQFLCHSPIKEVEDGLKTFFDETQKGYELENLKETNANLELKIKTKQLNEISFWNRLFGNIKENDWLVQRVSNEETMIHWKPKVPISVITFHYALNGFLGLLTTVVICGIFLKDKIEDPFALFSASILVIIYLSHIYFLAIPLEKRTLQGIDDYIRFIQKNEGIKIYKFKGYYGHTFKPFWLFSYPLLFFTFLYIYDFFENVPSFTLIFVLLLVFFLYVVLIMLMSISNLGCEYFRYRLSFAAYLLVINFTLLACASFPFILDSIYLLLQKNPFIAMTPFLDNPFKYILTLTLYVGLFLIYLNFKSLVDIGEKQRSELKQIKNQYKRFPFLYAISNKEEFGRYAERFKIIGITCAILFSLAWIWILFHTIGNVLFYMGKIKIHGAWVINADFIYYFSNILSFGLVHPENKIGQTLASLVLISPGLFMLGIYSIGIIKNNIYSNRIVNTEKLTLDEKKKLKVLCEEINCFGLKYWLAPEILVYDSFAIGSRVQGKIALGKSHAQLLISLGALQNLSQEELSYVIAHEMGHLDSTAFFNLVLVSRVSKVLIGAPLFLGLIHDIPQEEFRADSFAIQNLSKRGIDKLEQKYCQLLNYIDDYNSSIKTVGIMDEAFGSIGLSMTEEIRNNGNSESKKTLNVFSVLKNFRDLYFNVLLNPNFLNVHPLTDERIKAIEHKLS